MWKELVYIVFSATPVLIGIRKGIFKNHELAPFFLYCSVGFITELTFILLSRLSIKNDWLVNYWLLIEVALLSILFLRWFKNYYLKLATLLFLFLFLAVSLYHFIGKNTGNLNSTILIFEHIGIGLFSGIIIIKSLNDAGHKPISQPKFLIATGLFVFFLGSTLIYSTVDFLYSAKKPSWYDEFYLTLSLAFNYLAYTIYSIAFLCYSPKKN